MSKEPSIFEQLTAGSTMTLNTKAVFAISKLAQKSQDGIQKQTSIINQLTDLINKMFREGRSGGSVEDVITAFANKTSDFRLKYLAQEDKWVVVADDEK